MSTVFNDAADALRRAAKQHEIYVKTADALERVGSFAQAAQEAEKAAAAAAVERDKLLEEVEAAKVEKAKVKKAIEKLLLDAKQKSEEIASTAEADAKQRADEVIAVAEKRAQDIEVMIQSRLYQMSEMAAKSAAEIDRLAAEEKTLLRSIEEKEQKVQTLDTALERLRAKLV